MCNLPGLFISLQDKLTIQYFYLFSHFSALFPQGEGVSAVEATQNRSLL
jgi:hypothetical protein